MGRTAGAELSSLLLRASRRGAGPTSSTFLTACCNAGVWLRKFHDGMPQAGTSPVANDRDEFRRISEQKISEIERLWPIKGWWMALRESIERGLEATPEAFSRQATAHGDFWGGNVLCQPDGQVVVIDSFGVGRSPVYVDLAYFLLHLRATSAQIYSRGWWCSGVVLRECESAFLKGYDVRCPSGGRPLVLFQILVLLYKWASSIGRLEEMRGLEREYKRVTFAWRSRYYRQLIDGYVARLG